MHQSLASVLSVPATAHTHSAFTDSDLEEVQHHGAAQYSLSMQAGTDQCAQAVYFQHSVLPEPPDYPSGPERANQTDTDAAKHWINLFVISDASVLCGVCMRVVEPIMQQLTHNGWPSLVVVVTS